MTDADPLILTLAFDEPTFARFDGERRRHFPESLNRIPAHATLFHHLPGDRERGVIEAITALARTVPMAAVAPAHMPPPHSRCRAEQLTPTTRGAGGSSRGGGEGGAGGGGDWSPA